MKMNVKIENLLEELYQINPDFKAHEKTLKTLIKELLESNPNVEMEGSFSDLLREKIVHKASQLKDQKAQKSNFNFNHFIKQILFPFTGGVLATVMVISVINPLFETGQFDPAIISGIEARIAEVDASLNTCVKSSLTLSEESTATFYHKPEGLQKIKEEYLGETGKTIHKYFYEDEKLAHVIHETHEYNRPIYWNETKATEMNDDEFFDPEKTVVKSSAYYFENDRLIQWIDEEGAVINIEQDITQALQGNHLVQRSQALIWRYDSKKE